MGEALYGILLVCISSLVPAAVAQAILNVRPWKTALGVAALTSLGWLYARFPFDLMEPGFIVVMVLLMTGLALPLALAGSGLAQAIRAQLGERRRASDESPTGLEK